MAEEAAGIVDAVRGRWRLRRAIKRSQRAVGTRLVDDAYVRPGTVVTDWRGQQWIAMLMTYASPSQRIWWREVDAQKFHLDVEHRESALDGKRFEALDQLCGHH